MVSLNRVTTAIDSDKTASLLADESGQPLLSANLCEALQFTLYSVRCRMSHCRRVGYAHRPWARRLASVGIAHPTMARPAPRKVYCPRNRVNEMPVSRNEDWIRIAELDVQDHIRFTPEFQSLMGDLGWEAKAFVGHLLGLWYDPFEHMLD